jgi:hypothetical protein
VREHIEPLLTARFSGCLSIGVDDVLRAMHRDGLLDGNAWVDERGALLLRDWRGAAQMALTELARARHDHPGAAIVEGPIDDRWVAAHLKATDLARRSALIYLHAPVETRLRRNRARAANRVAEANLLAMATHFSEQVLAELAQVSRCVLSVDTASLDEATLLSMCAGYVAAYLDSFDQPAPGRRLSAATTRR